MKIVIIGGHLAPALSAVESLPENTDTLFIGRKFALEGDSAISLEYEAITARKIKFFPIVTGRMQRKFTKHTIFSVLKFPYGFIQSVFILKKFRPDVILGFGGYLSLPVAFAAFFLNIPIVIHEQTLDAGISNRIISLIARKVCISWESSRKYFPKEKTVLTGNPVREFKIQNSKFKTAEDELRIMLAPNTCGETSRTEAERNSELPIIYATGGSLGSHFINTLIENNLQKLLERFVIVHQTGDAQEFKDFDRLEELRKILPSLLKNRYVLTKFIDPANVGHVLQKASLIIGRSGINTITELLVFKKPSLLIPLPFSQGNEQIKNALFLKNKGIAEVYLQNEKKDFFELIIRMFDRMDTYKKNADKLENLANQGAADKIIGVLLLCSRQKEKTDIQ